MKYWTTERALIYICVPFEEKNPFSRRSNLVREIRPWVLDNIHEHMPEVTIKNAANLKRFAKKAKLTFGADFFTLKMHPAAWMWFAATQCWSSSKAIFILYAMWTGDGRGGTRTTNVQCREGNRWRTLYVDVNGQYQIERGIPFWELMKMKFKKVDALKEWCWESARLALSKPDRISDSRCCEDLIENAISQLPPGKVQKTSGADENQRKKYAAPMTGREDLLNALKQTSSGRRLRNYEISVVRRSLSNMVACRRGRAPGSKNQNKKRSVA